MRQFLQDLRYAARMLRKGPAFTAIAVISLALAIGANTAVFSIIDSWLIRPLPFKDSNRLAIVFRSEKSRPSEPAIFDFYRDYEVWNQKSQSFEQLGGVFWRPYTWTGWGDPVSISGMIATPNLFRMLGVKARIGRTFSTADAHGPAVAVLSYGFWQRRFGSRPDVIDKTLVLNSKPYQVIGVLPKQLGLRIVDQRTDQDVYTMIQPNEEGYRTGEYGNLAVLGRLKPGVTTGAAQAEISMIQHRLDARLKQPSDLGVVIETLQRDNTRSIRPSLLLLAATLLFVLLLVCANIAGLLAGRAIQRRKEIALPCALGSDFRRLLQQLMTENLLLAIVGGAAGLTIAYSLIRWFVFLNPFGRLPQNPIALDWRALLAAVAVTALAAAIFGVAPSLQASRLDLNAVLKGDSRTASGAPAAMRLRSGLVVAQIAISLALLIGSALMIGTLARLEHHPLGFRIRNLSTFALDLPDSRVKDTKTRTALFRALVTNLDALPGVKAAAVSSAPPLGDNGDRRFIIQGEAAPASRELSPSAASQLVSPGYFMTLQIPLLAGRAFTDRDNAASEKVAVVNEAAALHWFGGKAACGKRIQVSDEKDWRTIVGVVGNTASTFYNRLEWLTKPIIYMPEDQSATGDLSPVGSTAWMYVRGSTALSRDEVQRAVRAVAPEVPVADLQTMAEIVADSQRQPRLRTAVLSSTAGLALFLAALGIYGVVSQSVSQRTREIGIRMAVGADAREVFRLVLSQALRLAATGVAAGLAAALILTRALSSFLYGVAPTNVWVILISIGVLGAVTFAAAFVPARAATKVDPMLALHCE